MKRLFLIFGILLFLITTPVLAKKSENSERCDPEANWKNHGEYVSCVAKLHLGGASVSAAARSDVGKKDDDEDEPEVSPTPSPSASASASPSATPSPTGIGTTNSASQITIEGTKIEIRALIAVLQKIIESLKHLL